MAKNKFPQIIHVTREEDGKDSYLVAHEGGVQGLDKNQEPVAVYKRVTVGRVNIVKSFKESK